MKNALILLALLSSFTAFADADTTIEISSKSLEVSSDLSDLVSITDGWILSSGVTSYSTLGDREEEAEALRDDAVDYLAGDEMTYELEEFIGELKESAEMSELSNEEIASEIARM